MWRTDGLQQFGKDLVYHTDIEHPMSLHSETTYGTNYKVNFPSQRDEIMKNTKMIQNGFYAKEPLSLSNPFSDKTNPYLLPLDTRMFPPDGKENL